MSKNHRITCTDLAVDNFISELNFSGMIGVSFRSHVQSGRSEGIKEDGRMRVNDNSKSDQSQVQKGESGRS